MESDFSRVITLKHLLIRGEKMIGLLFFPDKVIQALVKELPDIKWSNEFGMAYLPNTKENLDLLFESFNGIVWLNSSHFFGGKTKSKGVAPISVNGYRERQEIKGVRRCPEVFFRKLELKHYALNTAKTYIYMFEIFLNHHPKDDLANLDEARVRDYLQQLVVDGRSDSYVHQMINAIKFYYEVVMEMPNRFYAIERPRVKVKLPKVISLEEVQSIIENTNNIKHKCVVSLLYSAGLRRAELINLELEDIDSKRMVITVKQGKGNKDRITVLSPLVLNYLREYFKIWEPKKYLFEGLPGIKYSAGSVLNIVTTAAKRAKISKRVTPHILRHSFATHLLENGTDIRYIQVLLGHNSTRTTETYTQVATNNIKDIGSPMELLNLK